jgi:hypothetical protein
VVTRIAAAAFGVVLAAGSAASSTVAFAQDAAAPAADAPAPEAAADAPAPETTTETTTETTLSQGSTIRTRTNKLKVRNRWDNGLDVKLTDAWERRASDVEAPTVVLSAQWNYKFITDTYVGLVVSGFPQSMRIETEVEDVDASVTGYWGGLNLGQGLYESWPFRVVLTVAAGQGFAYVRVKLPDEDAKADAAKFDFYEPGLFATFFAWRGLEFGVAASYRKVAMKDEAEGAPEDDDLTSVAYGLTFRTQRF